MDAVILAGGKGTRMRPLTVSTPKPLLQLQNRPILAWSLLSLHGIADHALIVVSTFKEQIADFMATQTIFADYTLVEQLPKPLGTGHALLCCRDHLRSQDFLVINGDDLYAHAALRQLSRKDFGILSIRRDDFDRYGVIVTDETGSLSHVDEKPPRDRYQAPAPCSIGAYKFRTNVFDYQLEKTARGEYEISDYVTAAAQDQAIAVVETPFWLPIGDPAALKASQTVDIERWIPPLSTYQGAKQD